MIIQKLRVAYIYKITNPNSKVYIGSTFHIKTRWNNYKNLRCKNQRILYRSFLKYGPDNHSFDIIEVCTNIDRYKREAYFGHLYNCLDRKTGLNLALPFLNDKFISVSKETSKKFSDNAKKRIGILNPCFGIKRLDFAIMAKERGKKLIGDKNPMFGKKRPKKVIDAVRLSRLKKENDNNSPRNKCILDLNTGVFYRSAMEVIKLYNFNKSTFVSMLNGNRQNKTNFIYA